METAFHPLQDLFDQLGLPSHCKAIAEFLANHAPIDSSIELANWDYWNADQREFLTSETLKDADWAGVIDLLNIQLRESK